MGGAVIGLLLHIMLLALAAPTLAGLCGRAAARWRGAEGPHVLQPWRDLVRLWRKGTVLPAGASFLFGAAPVAALATAGAAAVLVPGFTTGMATAPAADLVVVAALLALSRGVVAVAAWDAGSAVAVHAGGRALAARAGVAPVLLLVAFAALLLSGGTNLDATLAAIRDGGAGARVAGGLAGAALFAIALTEWQGGLDAWSGRLRAAALLAVQLRMVVALSLVAAFVPFGVAAAAGGWLVGMACWLLKLIVLGLLATAIGSPRLVLPAAALLATLAVVVAGLQGAA